MTRAATLLLALFLTGCSSLGEYRFDTAYDTRYQTVAVPVFENNTHEPGLELLVTEAVIKKIQTSTPWSVSAEGSAQTVLTGVITDAERRVFSRARRTGLVEEMAYVITVDFEWRDLATGEPIIRRRSFSASGGFVPALPAAEPQDVGIHGAADSLASDLVHELRTAW